VQHATVIYLQVEEGRGGKKNRRSRHETTNKNRKNNLLENATVDTKIKNKTGIHITRHVRRTVIGP
jgi:hypothetical protein